MLDFIRFHSVIVTAALARAVLVLLGQTMTINCVILSQNFQPFAFRNIHGLPALKCQVIPLFIPKSSALKYTRHSLR